MAYDLNNPKDASDLADDLIRTAKKNKEAKFLSEVKQRAKDIAAMQINSMAINEAIKNGSFNHNGGVEVSVYSSPNDEFVYAVATELRALGWRVITGDDCRDSNFKEIRIVLGKETI